MSNRAAAASTALLLCCLAPGLCQGGEDCGAKARDLLQKISKKYRNLEVYDAAYQVELPVTEPGQSGTVSAQVRLSSDGPNRSRAEFTATPQPGMDFRMLTISNGDSTWTLLTMRPLLNKYTCEAASALDPGGTGSGLFSRAGNLFARYEDLPQNAAAPCISGSEVVSFMGRSVECDVVEFGERLTLPTAPVDSAHVTLWIDKKSSLVLKETATAPSFESANHLVRGTFGKRLPDSLFVFTPPADARRVDTLTPSEAPEPELSGQAAADFTLADMEGHPVHLSDLQGKVVLLDFWATWCGPCRRELPAIRAIRGEFTGDDLVVLAVNVREKLEAVAAFLSKNGSLGVPVLLDAAGVVSALYRVTAIPTLVVIDRRGNVAWSHMGLAPAEDIRRAVKLAEATR